jgi:Zn-dependent metalloprotease
MLKKMAIKGSAIMLRRRRGAKAVTVAQRALESLSLTQSLSVARVGATESLRLQRQARRAQRLSLGMRRFLVDGNKQRMIYTANQKQKLPGTAVRNEGDPATGDPAVDEAYDYMGDCYDFFAEVFQRDSIDDEGMPLRGTVHFGEDYDNAFWDGQRMIYGDGDGEVFDRFTKSIDVIGHELTHGVTEHEAGLIYFGQPGALNESMSDVMGSLLKQYVNNQKATAADWIIGEGLLMPGINGVGIRSMKAPGTAYDDPLLGKDPQPAHMKKYVRGLDDNGGVHVNSGIPNHAFYRMATKLGGFAWQTVGPIWYRALQSPLLRRAANFQAFARLTVMTAQQLYPGLNSPEQQAVREGWSEVGISV